MMNFKTTPLAYWGFDENDPRFALNSVEGGQPLVIHGARRVPGKGGAGGALRFRFWDDYASGPALGPLPAFTVGFWFQVDAQVRKATLLEFQGLVHLKYEKINEAGLAANIANQSDFNRPLRIVGDSPVKPDCWQHVAIRFSSDEVALFLEGRMIGSLSHRPRPLLPMVLSRQEYVSFGGLGLEGGMLEIDAASIFQAALNETEIRELMAGGPALSIPAPPAARPPRTVDAGDFIDPRDPACGIQRAIDSLGPWGGAVRIPSGRYLMRRGLILRSYTSLLGEGRGTVLEMAPPHNFILAVDAKAGENSLILTRTEGLAVGDAILARSVPVRGWYGLQTFVKKVAGARLEIPRPLFYDLLMADKASVVQWFPMVTALAQHEVSIRQLTIQGPPDLIPEIWPEVDFQSSAVHLVCCFDSEIDHVQVGPWPHDGFSVQVGRRVRVANCSARQCSGHGYHPGTSVQQTMWLHNIGVQNRVDGLYFCAGTRNATIAHCLFESNGRYGIGGLDRNEECNIISANQVIGNGLAGIQVSGNKGGDPNGKEVGSRHNLIINNVIHSNSRAEPGKYPGIEISRQANAAIIAGNQILNPADNPTQPLGITEDESCRANIIRDNVLWDCELKLAGQDSHADGNLINGKMQSEGGSA